MSNSNTYHKGNSSVSAEDLSQDDLLFLANLNDRLAEIETKIKDTSNKIGSDAQGTVFNSNGWLQDYEIECVITFCLRKDDPDYIQDDDNILAQLTETLKTNIWDWGIADGINHNEYYRLNHPMKDDFHCWLYHCLYDHTRLGWSNILRIGDIWVDIQVSYQHFSNTSIVTSNSMTR